MTKLKEEYKFDLRTLEQELRSGAINLKDYEAYLKSLEDCENDIDYVEVYEEPTLPEETITSEGSLTFSPDDSTSSH